MEVASGAAALAGVAALAAQLGKKLFEVWHELKGAEPEIAEVANSVLLLSTVLEELDAILKRNKGLYRPELEESVAKISSRCQKTIEDIERTAGVERDKTCKKSLVAKLAWCFRKDRVKLLSASLESLKSTLDVLLHVVVLAKVTGRVKAGEGDPNSSNPNKDAGKETRVLQSLLLDNILKLKTLQQLEHQSQQKHAHARHRTPSDQPASAFSPANVGQTEKRESACEEASDDESQAQTPRMAEHLPFWRRRCSDVYRDMNLSSPDQESYQEEHEAAGDGPHANEDGDLLLYQPSTSQLILDVVHSRLRDAGSRDAIVWRGDRVGQAVRSLLEEYIYVDAVGTDEHISPLEEKVSGQNTIPRSSPEVAQAHYPYGSEPPFWEHRSTIDVADSDASPTRHEQRRNMKPTESDRVHGIDLQTVFGQGEASCGKHRTREKRRQSGTFISSDDTTNSSGSDIRRDMPLDADHGRTSRFKIQNNHDQDQRVNSRHFARRRKCEVRLASDRRTHELDHTLAFLEAIANRVASPYNEVLRTKAKYKTLKHEVVLERAIAQAKKDTLDAVKAERGNRSESHHRRGESERVTLKDFLGRTFTLPVQSCDTWQNMQELIASTFEKGDPRRDEIESGKYDLLESSGEVILPAVWAALVQSGMTVELRIRSLEAQELGRTTNGRKRGGPIETPTSHSLSDGVVVGGESPRSSRRRLSAAKDWFGRKVSPREREIGTASFPAADL